MYARSIRVSRFAAIVSLATLPILMTGTAEAYQCKIVKTYAQAIGPAQANTIANAKTIWAAKVTNKLDLQWSSWDIAASKTQNCAWTGNNYQCTVGAKPCLYVVP